MAHPLGLWHSLFMPFYAPATVARILARRSPFIAARVVETLAPRRALRVLAHMSEAQRLRILNQLGDYLYRLAALMDQSDLADLLVKLKGGVVRRLSLKTSGEAFLGMLDLWDEVQLQRMLTNIHPRKGAILMAALDKDQQVLMLRRLQPWVQAALIKDMPPEVRADVIDGLHLEGAIDLLTRWGLDTQSGVLRAASKARRMEVFQSMRPRMIADITQLWPQDEQLELLNSMTEEQMVYVLFNYDDKIKKQLFQLLPPGRQRYVIANLRGDQAAMFLRFLDNDDEVVALLRMLDERTAGLIQNHLSKKYDLR